MLYVLYCARTNKIIGNYQPASGLVFTLLPDFEFEAFELLQLHSLLLRLSLLISSPSLVDMLKFSLPNRLERSASARRPKLSLLILSEYYIIVKAFNNGSLGSGMDEERSRLR